MVREFLKPLIALALIASPVAVAAQEADDTATAENANGTGLLIGGLVTLAALVVILFHDELFDDDDNDAPASP